MRTSTAQQQNILDIDIKVLTRV